MPDISSPINGPLHVIGVHIAARARLQSTGEQSLRATPDGFGTPAFGPDSRRVRIAGTALVVESEAGGEPRVEARSLDGTTLRQLAEVAGVDLDRDIYVGDDAPPLGDPDAPLAVDAAAARALARTYAVAATALDRALVALGTQDRGATLPRLWPEHFDLAVDLEVKPGTRANLGVSPGDGFHAGPYAYVGPWTAERPGDPDFWNAPFGAYLPLDTDRPDPSNPADRAARFFLDGVSRLG